MRDLSEAWILSAAILMSSVSVIYIPYYPPFCFYRYAFSWRKNLKLLMDNNGSESAWRNVNIIAFEPLLNACHVKMKPEMKV
jgi:hypothetical protein